METEEDDNSLTKKEKGIFEIQFETQDNSIKNDINSETHQDF